MRWGRAHSAAPTTRSRRSSGRAARAARLGRPRRHGGRACSATPGARCSSGNPLAVGGLGALAGALLGGGGGAVKGAMGGGVLALLGGIAMSALKNYQAGAAAPGRRAGRQRGAARPARAAERGRGGGAGAARATDPAGDDQRRQGRWPDRRCARCSGSSASSRRAAPTMRRAPSCSRRCSGPADLDRLIGEVQDAGGRGRALCRLAPGDRGRHGRGARVSAPPRARPRT